MFSGVVAGVLGDLVAGRLERVKICWVLPFVSTPRGRICALVRTFPFRPALRVACATVFANFSARSPLHTHLDFTPAATSRMSPNGFTFHSQNDTPKGKRKFSFLQGKTSIDNRMSEKDNVRILINIPSAKFRFLIF